MPVLEALSDEEKYLVTILSDPSGLDQAEFLWHDARNDDGCFRAWPYQVSWWRITHPLQIDQCGRSVGKSQSIVLRACAFPFLHPQQEMVITGPEGIHVDLITDLIERQVVDTRLLRELLVAGRSGIKHRPFHMNFANGTRIMGRIPHRDGSGVKGIHPLWLELDEAQDYPRNGWTELTETLKRGVPGAMWRAHGVTRGVRDKFFDFTQEEPEDEEGPDWYVHRFTAMHRPNWTDKERKEKIKQYGSRDDPDYRRNVIGAHGDATNPLFVLHRLMRCVDDDKSSDYNLDEYVHFELKDMQIEDQAKRGRDIVDMLELPSSHLGKYQVFWCGMDVGLTTDPTEILVFGEYQPSTDERNLANKVGKAIPDKGMSRLKLLTRISLMRVSHPHQVRAVLHVIDHYKPSAFAMDKTGIGLNLFQDIQDQIEKAADTVGRERAKHAAESIKGYGFAEKVLVDLDETVELGENPDPAEAAKAAGIARNVLEYSTDKLREYVDNERLWLPWDRELVGEFQGQTYSYSKATMDLYGRRRRIFSEGKFHALDAARMAAMGHAQHAIEAYMATPPQRPVLDVFVMA